MKQYIRDRWLNIHKGSQEEATKLLQNWSSSTIKKFWNASGTSRTAEHIAHIFPKDEWRQMRTYNPQFPNWEYFVLLKLVRLGTLKCKISRIFLKVDGKIQTRDVLLFQNPNLSKEAFEDYKRSIPLQFNYPGPQYAYHGSTCDFWAARGEGRFTRYMKEGKI